MGTGESAAELLAAGAEALLEAAFRTGDYADIQPRLQAARVRAGADGDRATKAAALDRLGWLLHFQALDHGVEHADADAEEALFQQALAIRRDIQDPAGVAGSLFGVGLFQQVLRRDWDAAMPYFWEALALADQHGDELTRGDPRWIPSGTLALGQAELAAGNRAEAIRRLREAVGQARAAGLRQRRIDQAEEALRRAEAGGPPTHR